MCCRSNKQSYTTSLVVSLFYYCREDEKNECLLGMKRKSLTYDFSMSRFMTSLRYTKVSQIKMHADKVQILSLQEGST